MMFTKEQIAERGFYTQHFEQGKQDDTLILNMGPQHPSTHGVLRVQLDDASTEIRMSITVAHHEKNHYGLSCREIDLDSVTHLRRLVTLNAGDDALLTREIALLSTG